MKGRFNEYDQFKPEATQKTNKTNASQPDENNNTVFSAGEQVPPAGKSVLGRFRQS